MNLYILSLFCEKKSNISKYINFNNIHNSFITLKIQKQEKDIEFNILTEGIYL